MKKKNTSPLFWFFIMFASIALIGFGVTPAVADSGAYGDVEEEGSFVVLDEFEGEDLDAMEGDETFGSSSQATWLAAQEFDPMDSGMTWNRGSGGIGSFRCRTAGGTFWFDAPIRLPSGARLTIARMFYDDFSATSRIILWLTRTAVSESNGVAASVSYIGSSGGVASPTGVRRWGNVAINTGTTIANRYNIYSARARIETGTCLIGVRLFWNRQQAPAGGQIFNDVPGGQFFQAINNMYRSGITTGCPYPNYCPKANVTREQMAAFFARALGLHWAYSSGY